MLRRKRHAPAQIANLVIINQARDPRIVRELMLQVLALGRQAAHRGQRGINPRIVLLIRVDDFLRGLLVAESVRRAREIPRR